MYRILLIAFICAVLAVVASACIEMDGWLKGIANSVILVLTTIAALGSLAFFTSSSNTLGTVVSIVLGVSFFCIIPIIGVMLMERVSNRK